jgi:hypothetical protein
VARDGAERSNAKTHPRRSVLVGALVVVVATYAPFALHWSLVGSSDFDQFATFHRIALWWHQLGDRTVTWNPFLCGGATLVGNPQIPLLHPNLLFSALLGPVNGLGAAFVPWVLAGYFGMRALARDVGVAPEAATAVAVAWPLCGFFVAHIGSMHGTFFAFWALPGVAWMHRRIAREGAGLALALYPFAIALLAGYNVQFIAYGLPFVGLHALFEIAYGAPRRRAIPRLAAYGLAVGLGLGLTGVSLLPTLAWSREFPRLKAPQFVHPVDLLQMIVSPVALVDFPRDHRAHEYMLTLGPGLVLLAAWALWRGDARRPALRPVLLTGALSLLTAVGSLEAIGGPPVAPFDLLRRFAPGFGSVRAPARFLVFGLIPVLLLAGFGWSRWVGTSARRRALAWGLAVVPLVGLAFGYYQWKLYRSIEGVEMRAAASLAPDFRWAPLGHRRQSYAVLRPNTGVLDCYDALEIPRAPELDVDRGLVLESDVPVEVRRISWGELEITTSSSTLGARRVAFNFNHHRGWTVVDADGEARVASDDGAPLALELGPDARRVRIRHVDPSWTAGVWLSVASGLSALGFAGVVLAVRRRRARGSPAAG